jgi:CHAT domain-containing protein/Tfp pilus assembly protein PilF
MLWLATLVLAAAPLVAGESGENYNDALFEIGAARSEQALDTLQRLVRRDPSFERAYPKILALYRQSNRMDAATAYFEGLLTSEPQSSYSNYAVALLRKQNKQYADADLHLRRSIELNPGFLPAYTELVSVAKLQNRHEQTASFITAQQNPAAHYGLGYLYMQQAAWEKALEQVRQGPESCEVWNTLYLIYYKTDRYDDALHALDGMRMTAEKSDDLEWLARSLGRAGMMHVDRGDYSQAITNLKRAIQISRKIGDRASEQTYRGNLGLAHVYLADYRTALEECRRALAISRELGHRLNEGRNLGLIAGVHSEMAAYGEAIDGYNQAIVIAREVRDRPSEADQLASLGQVYLALGDATRALDSVRKALEIARGLNNPWLVGKFLEVLGTVQIRLGKPREALEAYEQGLRAAVEVGDKLGQATRLALMAAANGRLGQPLLAFDGYRKALEITHEIRAAIVEGRIRNDLGSLHLRQGDPARAREEHQLALRIGEQVKMPEVVWRAYAGIAAAEQSAGRADKAVPMYRSAIDAVENVRARLLVAEEKAGFLEDKIDVYQRFIKLLVGLGRKVEAFHYAERSKARSFLDLIAEPAGSESAKGARVAAFDFPQPLHVEQAQQLLGPRTVLLEYAVGKEASYLFALTRQQFHVAQLPSSEMLSTQVQQLRRAIGDKPSRGGLGDYLVHARSLYRSLIQPAAALMLGKTELIIVPDSSLHSVPFDLLVKPEGSPAASDLTKLPYLIREASISYTPSASILAALNERHGHVRPHIGAFLAFADPSYGTRLARLAGSRTEVESIAALYPPGQTRIYAGPLASEENVKADGVLDGYGIIHFAAHGILNETKPQFSGLALTPPAGPNPEDGLLQMDEILNLKLNADLVVLSACETALGKAVQGEGLVGLTQGFLRAGSASVIASLWKVEDRSTADLMIAFHRRLKDGRLDKAAALRRAKLELITQGTFAHPYYWAPFVLVGETRSSSLPLILSSKK